MVLICALAWLAAGHAGAQSTERLGKVNFPTSCAPAAQPHFERGVALLHSFWFGEAIKAFQAAAVADPSCGIAHWGTAVAYLGNPLAGPPTPRGLQEGSAAVTRAKAAGAKSQRELDYIAAIEAFYKDADKSITARARSRTRTRWKQTRSATRPIARRRSSTRSR